MSPGEGVRRRRQRSVTDPTVGSVAGNEGLPDRYNKSSGTAANRTTSTGARTAALAVLASVIRPT